MIFFKDRFFNTVAIADAEITDGLKLLEDSLNEEIESGTCLYTATLDKNHPSVEKIEAGNYVFITNNTRAPVVVEVMEVEENRDTKKIIAEDAGLDLLNEDTGDLKFKGTLAEFIKKVIGTDSGWEIGLDEIQNEHNLTLEYEGITNQTKRINQIAKRFGAEVSFSFDFDEDRDVIKHKYINFHKERGRDLGRRLVIGEELKLVKRNVSITDLCTAIRPIGKPHKETIKTPKTVTETVNVEKPGATTSSTTKTTNPKLKKLVGWFESRKGKVRYSMYSRMGPNSYDCSSAVHFAAKHAGLIPKNHFIGNTESMFKWKNKYVTEISRNDIRYGDIFISGREGASSGAAGHTGVVYDKNRIIHCTYGRNGIALTPINGYIGGPPTRWFRFKNTEPVTQTKGSNKAYWTNNDLTKHDLGFNLPGLTAGQLNNWIKASNPKSAFKGHGNVFIEAQKQSGLDARYILAHAALESAWGNSYYGRKHHNYFGIGAFDNNPDNAKNFSNAGLATGIIEGAKWISKNYYNSSYKQTTLYKMRHNGGVHQYATDPNWHTKIANIMKRSERYTKPASTNSKGEIKITKTITKTIYEESEVERDTNLINYEYDDGRYFVTDNGLICDREQGKVWSRHHNDKMGYIVKIYNSEATSQKTLFDEGLRQLQANNQPKVSYQVDLNYLPEDIQIGDWVRLIDHDYSPALYLDARLVDVTRSTVNPQDSKATFANFDEKPSGIESSLLNLQGQLDEQRFRWAQQPYQITITSSSGETFKDNVISTNLIANVTRLSIDQTAMVDEFIWERHSAYPDKNAIEDSQWNEEHIDYKDNVIEITADDVDMEATFTCTAMIDEIAVAVASYTIKDLTIGVYVQKEEPKNPGYGDVWKWPEENINKIYTEKEDGSMDFVDVVVKRDLSEIEEKTDKKIKEIELTPGPPGPQGPQGLPGPAGKDGVTTYTWIRYADDANGKNMSQYPDGKSYLGIASNQKSTTESNNPQDYKWSKIEGEKGQAGSRGPAGETLYTWIKYADDEDGNGMSDNPEGKRYLGIAYNKSTPSKSTNRGDYSWSPLYDNVSVGGRNYILNGEEQRLLRGFTLGYHLSTAKEDLAGAPAILTFEARHTADSSPVLIHGYYRNDVGDNLDFSYPIGNKMTTTDWQRFVVPIDPNAIPDTMDGVDDFYLRKDGSDNNVDIRKVKLEIGNISTSFTLAPEDWQSQIDEKAGQDQVSDLEQAQSAVQSLLEQYPSADSLNNLSGQYSDLDAYTKVLQDAIDSNKTDVLDRFKILEANVGSGQAFMQAISRYLSFGEEGLVLGQEGNALKVAIDNEKISFLDSGKEVAYVSGQMLYILSGVFLNTLTIGNHKIEKLADSNKITTISWIGG